MANDNSYILPLSDSINEDSSDEVTEIVQEQVLPVPSITKPQIKVSWVWTHFIKKHNEKGEMHAYCQFEMEDGKKCTKNYKYDGSTGNLSSHAIRHGIIPPSIESISSEVKTNPVQTI